MALLALSMGSLGAARTAGAQCVVPELLGSYSTPDIAYGVTVAGTVAYVADWHRGLQIIEVSTPAAPVLLGAYDTPGSAFGVTAAGTTAYVADHNSGLQIIDASNGCGPADLTGDCVVDAGDLGVFITATSPVTCSSISPTTASSTPVTSAPSSPSTWPAAEPHPALCRLFSWRTISPVTR